MCVSERPVPCRNEPGQAGRGKNGEREVGVHSKGVRLKRWRQTEPLAHLLSTLWIRSLVTWGKSH